MATEPTALTRACDERGIILSAPLPYAALLGAVQCLRLSQRGEAEALRTKLWTYMQAAATADPQAARVPCDILRAATLSLRKWHTATKTECWGPRDDAELTAAWRKGLNAPAPVVEG